MNGRRIWESAATDLGKAVLAQNMREPAFVKAEIHEAAQPKVAKSTKPTLAEHREQFLSRKKRRKALSSIPRRSPPHDYTTKEFLEVSIG